MIDRTIRRIHTFILMPVSLKFLFAEALLTSAWIRTCLSFFSFRKITEWLGQRQTESAADPDETSLVLRRNIQRVLQLCNRYAPWPTECYTIALTGKLLLKRRSISSTLYIGIDKDEKGDFKGHAWLRSRDTYITGYGESTNFRINYFFS